MLWCVCTVGLRGLGLVTVVGSCCIEKVGLGSVVLWAGKVVVGVGGCGMLKGWRMCLGYGSGECIGAVGVVWVGCGGGCLRDCDGEGLWVGAHLEG